MLMTTFRANLEAKASHKAQVAIPPELMDAYIMQRTGWTFEQLRTTPHYLIEQIEFIWHLENVAKESGANSK